MRISSRRGTIVFFLCLGIGLVALAVALNVGWIILNWREGVLLFFGIVFFALIIAGMVVNTIFLVRELRRSEQHDSFINAVTHELKTPVASIRLHLETLQRRELPEPQKQEFYRLMLSDTDRLTETVEQVLRAGRAGDKKAGRGKSRSRFRPTGARLHGRHPSAASLAAGGAALPGGVEQRERTAGARQRGRFANGGFQCARQRGEILRGECRCAGATGNARRKAHRAAGAGSGRGDSSRRCEAHLQTLLSGYAPFAGACERHRAGLVYREGDRAEAWRQSVRRERGRRAGNHDRARTAEVGGMSRVLVVEDEAHLAQGLRFNLEAEGYAAEVVGDGEAATDRLLEKKENFDAVVLDIMLPGKDGFSVVSELRAARNYVPVLMLTARGRPEDVLKGFASGADDYLAKPFDLSILLARLQGLLRRSQWMRGQASAERERERQPMPAASAISEHFHSAGRRSTSARWNCGRARARFI